MNGLDGLTKKNTLPLPLFPSPEAPTCWHKELWFAGDENDPGTERFDDDCIDALIAKGIGDRGCPTEGKLAAFCVAGSIIAAITGKYLSPDRKNDLWAHTEERIWAMLWSVSEKHKETTNISFLAAALRSFLPREHYCPHDRPYYTSRFVRRWKDVAYPLAWTYSLEHIRRECIEMGNWAFNRLPPSTASVVEEAAHHMPIMLAITIEYIYQNGKQ